MPVLCLNVTDFGLIGEALITAPSAVLSDRGVMPSPRPRITNMEAELDVGVSDDH